MKKYKLLVFIIPILMLILIFSFAATCGSTSNTATKVTNNTSGTSSGTTAVAATTSGETVASATTAQNIFNVGESADLNGTVVTVTKFQKSNGGDLDKPKAGYEYVTVTIKINNNSNSNVSYNPFYFKMQNSQGQITQIGITIFDKDTALQSGELTPNGTVEGTVTFEEPKDDPELTLLYQPNMFSDNIVIKFSIK